MGSDLYMNPPRQVKRARWVNDHTLVIESKWDGQKWVESARFDDPSEDVIIALNTAYNVPDKPNLQLITVSSRTLYEWNCQACHRVERFATKKAANENAALHKESCHADDELVKVAKKV